MLLPFVEQRPLADSMDYERPIWDPVNANAISTKIETFLCPSATGGLDHFAVRGSATEIAGQIKARFGTIADRSAASYSTFTHQEKIDFIDAMKA